MEELMEKDQALKYQLQLKGQLFKKKVLFHQLQVKLQQNHQQIQKDF